MDLYTHSYSLVIILRILRPDPCSSGNNKPGKWPRTVALFLRGRIIMERADLQLGARNDRLAYIVERCLESQAAYKLFDMLA